MNGCGPPQQIIETDMGQSGIAHHVGQSFLIRMLIDRFDQVLIGRSIASDPLPHFWPKGLKKCVRRLGHFRGHLRELEHNKTSSWFECLCHRSQCSGFIGDVAKTKGHGDAVYGSGLNG